LEAFAQAAVQLARVQEQSWASSNNNNDESISSDVVGILTDGYRYFTFKLEKEHYVVDDLVWILNDWSDVENVVKVLWRLLRSSST